MAKKKKAAVNPARGFATTSVASKPKVEKVEQALINEPSKDKTSEHQSARVLASTGTNGNDVTEKELFELTPEELEERLETSELQLLVERYGPKVQRDVQRQVSKMQADQRVLRGQSLSVNISPWLPGDVLLQVLKLAKTDAIEDSQTPRHDVRQKQLPEDEMAVRCWCVYQTLSHMGIARPKILQVLTDILHLRPNTNAGDSIWGFSEALDMLALDEEESALPPYENRGLNVLVFGDAGSDSDSRPVSAGSSSSIKGISRSREQSSSSTPTLHPQTIEAAEHGVMDPPESTDATEEDFTVSDLDSDTEPEQLISMYLSVKARLYKIRSNLVDEHSHSKSSRLKVPTASDQPLSHGIRRLLQKMKQFESDALFDQRAADLQWTPMRNEIAQQTALDNRLKALPVTPTAENDRPESIARTSPDKHPTSRVPEFGPFAEPDEAPEASEFLGGMFSTVEVHAATANAELEDQSNHVRLRDFGKMSGMHPRRVLEDACRSRDSGVKFNYRMVSPTVYSCRHSLKISWCKAQEKLRDAGPDFVRLDQESSIRNSQSVTAMDFMMVGVSTPDVQQSEAYVATAALFWIFANSASESKAYLKLPPKWRELWSEFVERQKEQAYRSDRKEFKMLRDLVQEQKTREEEDGVILSAAFSGRSKAGTPSRSREPGQRAILPSDPGALQGLWQRQQSTPSYQRMLLQRVTLPMFGFKEAALLAIEKHQVLILCGETGCGKSTQLPAYVLERELSHGRNCKIYCTQPRRISAISLAQRVSEELGNHKNDLGTFRSLVGYAIRLETKVALHTKLVYATVGIVLRMLESSNSLDDVTHLIVDEVHERSIDTDFLLIVLRSLMLRRPELKVILMSATVNASRFSKYLNNAPILNVPGRTFPVQTMFLEDAIELLHYSGGSKKAQDTEFDAEEEAQVGVALKQMGKLQQYSAQTRALLSEYDEYRIDFELILRLIERVFTDPTYIPYSSAVLVFLPGIAEIRELNDMLMAHPIFNQTTLIYPLHSSIANDEQQSAFLPPPPGIRKVVLATNIAETGITIPDVTCVIDTGKHKEMRYDERRQLSRLIQSFISRANAKQRRGRAGRVQEGLCFHLFTKYRHDELMAEQQTPEMLRLSLQDLVMRVKICKLGDIEQTLAQALDPPASKNIRRAIDALIEVGALTVTQDLTQLGSQLAKLPLDANLGKLCLLSAVFSCLDVGVTIAAILSSKSPFVTPFGQRQAADNARLSFAKNDSDLLTAYNAYNSWRRVSKDSTQNVFQYCRKNFLSQQNLTAIEDLKCQLLAAMADTGLISPSTIDRPNSTKARGPRTRFVQIPPELNKNSASDIITTSVIAWSFYPKLLTRDGKGWRNINNSQSVTLHPTSVARAAAAAAATTSSASTIKYLSYYSLMQAASSAKTYNALSTTPVQDFALLVGVAGDADWRLHAGVCVIDGNRLRFKVGGWKAAVALKVLRRRLEQVVEARLREPGRPLEPRLVSWVALWERICAGEAKGGSVGDRAMRQTD